MSYRNRALVLGCSFTNGSYTLDPDFISYTKVEQPDGSIKLVDTGLGRERLDTNGTWVGHLSKQDHYTVYSTGGVGICQHSAVVEYYYEKNQLQDFDYIVVQTTWEPRLVWNKPLPLPQCFWQEEKIDHDNITMHTGNDTSKYFNFNTKGGRPNFGGLMIGYEPWQIEMFNGKTNSNIIQSCATYVDEMCRLCNKKLFYFPFAEYCKRNGVEFENGQLLDVPFPWGVGKGTFDIFMDPNYHNFCPIDPKISMTGDDIFIGHYNDEGNRIIGERVSKELEKHL